MTGFEIIILIVCVVVIAGVIGTYLTKGQPSMEEFLEEPKKEKFQPRKITVVEKETEAVAQELYNKDLRPVVAKKAPKEEKTEVAVAVETVKKDKQPKSEFPIDKPKKKRKYYPKKK